MENRPVKFQNAFQYYDQMYDPGITSVLKSSFQAKNTDISSVDYYYQSLFSLFTYVSCFLDQDNYLSMTKFYFKKILEGEDLKEISKSYLIPLPFLKNIIDSSEDKNTQLMDTFILVKKRIDLSRVYAKPNLINQLKPRLKAIINQLNEIKIELFYRMKINKLFVPTSDFDPGHAVREGFSKLH